MRLDVYVDFLTELSKAYEALWALARREHDTAGQDHDAAARLILRSGAIYQTRHRLRILASQSVRTSGNVVFGNLAQLRAAAGAGHVSDSPEFKSVNESYRVSIEAFLEDIRTELDLPD